MINDKNNISIYKNAFDVTHWKNKDKIKELQEEMNSMSRIISKYLKKIEKDFPNLTDHSILHSNMLWEYADIIIGQQKYYLNPCEAFVLNGAFLLHDAGMCYSILNNKKELEADVYYTDYILNNKGKILGDDLKTEALFYTVRQRHGDFAIKIALEILNDEEFFISNIKYREEFGEIIGKIAKSHTCNINYIDRELGKEYISPLFPNTWAIDIKKISLILRVSDAAHIDNLRTPKTLKMIKEIEGESKQHWTFQKKIGMPKLDLDGYLIYSINKPFKTYEQKAWWHCYDALQVLDKELKNANNYFLEVKQLGFSAKRVKYIDDTLALGINSIKTEEWDSIDTSVRVTKPIHIASELGGEKLYGNKNIAIREIIQNSIDAIHVHRIFTGQKNVGVGKIKIVLEKINEDYFLTITDNGIGMNQNILTSELLDFGNSYWKSNKFYFDFKGLVSQGFESIGKFGIGFFSIFMLGKEVTVTSWKYSEDITTMRTLDFYDGLNSNPILRKPTQIEKDNIIDRGTSVKIKLENNPYAKGGILYNEFFRENSFKSLVQYYVPNADVEIQIEELDNKWYIEPNKMNRLNAAELLNYVNLKKRFWEIEYEDDLDVVKYNGIESEFNINDLKIEPIEIIQNERLLGRLSLLPMSARLNVLDSALVISNGIRVDTIHGYIGYILTDEVISIKRDRVKNIISFDSMKIWVEKILLEINKNNLVELYKDQIQDFKISFDLFDDSFPIVKTKRAGKEVYLSITEFRKYVRKNKKVVFYEENKQAKNKNKDCDGFINIYYGVSDSINYIINKDDISKVNSSDKIIRKILKEEWGGYNQNIEDFSLAKNRSNIQYSTIWTLTPKSE